MYGQVMHLGGSHIEKSLVLSDNMIIKQKRGHTHNDVYAVNYNSMETQRLTYVLENIYAWKSLKTYSCVENNAAPNTCKIRRKSLEIEMIVADKKHK